MATPHRRALAIAAAMVLVAILGGSGPAMPNLVMKVTVTPPQFHEGDKVTFEFWIENLGDAAYSPRPGVSFSVDNPPSAYIDAPGAPGTSLAPGESTRHVKYIWTAKCGAKIQAKVGPGPGGHTTESNEADNVWEKIMDATVCQPPPRADPALVRDLKFEVVKKVSPTSGEVKITAVLKNQGTDVLRNNCRVYIERAESSMPYHFLPIHQEDFPANSLKVGDVREVQVTTSFTVQCGDLPSSPYYRARIELYVNYPNQPIWQIDGDPSNNQTAETNSKAICNQL